MSNINHFGQPIGKPLPNWQPCPLPQPVTLTGRTCRLEPLNVTKHLGDLYAAFSLGDGRLWTYMYREPFTCVDDFRKFIEMKIESKDQHFAVIDLKIGKAVGMIALTNAGPMHGVVDVGAGIFSPLLKRSVASTEAHFLLMAYVFDKLGYLRIGVGCESHNELAKNAVLRLGLSLEGIFRNYRVEKGRSWDVAWFSVIDDEWPIIKAALNNWLAPENFDQLGRQIRKLEDIRESIKLKIDGVHSHL